MGQTKKAVYKVHNGTDFDEIMFKTSEDLLVGQNQMLSENGYRQLPGGLIIQWGYSLVEPTGTSINMPIRFPNGVFSVSTTVSDPGTWSANITARNQSYIIVRHNFEAGKLYVGWIVLGY